MFEHEGKKEHLDFNTVILTRSLLFLFELLLRFLIFRLRVKVVVAVLGELPLVGLVH